MSQYVKESSAWVREVVSQTVCFVPKRNWKELKLVRKGQGSFLGVEVEQECVCVCVGTKPYIIR